MKLHLLATVAIAAAAISAPAFAEQAIGSVGVTAATTNIEAGGLEADGQTYSIDGSIALKASDAWTVNLQGAGSTNDGDLGEDESATIGAAATYAAADWRVGPTVSYTDTGNAGLWAIGGVAQKYIGDVTLSGGITYGNFEDVDADLWSFGGEVRYFVNDNFRINGGLNYISFDTGGTDFDGWVLGVGGEYQFASTPWSVTGGYTHGKVNDLDVDSDTFSIGLRYSFGGDLKARDRSGADLGTNGFSTVTAIFN